MATLKPRACRTPLQQFSRAVRRKSARDKYKYGRREKGGFRVPVAVIDGWTVLTPCLERLGHRRASHFARRDGALSHRDTESAGQGCQLLNPGLPQSRRQM
jgi:hypothetical protein